MGAKSLMPLQIHPKPRSNLSKRFLHHGVEVHGMLRLVIIPTFEKLMISIVFFTWAIIMVRRIPNASDWLLLIRCTVHGQDLINHSYSLEMKAHGMIIARQILRS